MPKENKKVAKNAPDNLKLLWSNGFFKTWKKYLQIVKKLSDGGYNFTAPELGMALKRARHLTRRGKRTNFEYIQKYPYAEEKSKKQ